MLVGRALSTFLTFKTCRASGVMPGVRSICNTPLVDAPTGFNVSVPAEPLAMPRDDALAIHQFRVLAPLEVQDCGAALDPAEYGGSIRSH